MPIHDYVCHQCEQQFEMLVKLGQKPDCPACQASGDAIEQLLSLPAVSTEKSRKRNFTQARRAAQEVKKEKDHAQREYERNYIRDHS